MAIQFFQTANFANSVTATSFVKSGGTSSQYLMADGSVSTGSSGDVAWADITSKPTTISGFGITDAFDGAYSSLTGTPTIPTDFVSKANGGTFGGSIKITSGVGGKLHLRSTDTAIVDGDYIGNLYFEGVDSGGAADSVGASIHAIADGTWSNTVAPTELIFKTRNTTGGTTTALTLSRDQSATFAGAVTINQDGDALNLRSTTNAVKPRITFSSDVPDAQIGHIEYSHSNTASYGSGESFVIGGNQSDMTILADGKLMYKEGIYSKPATGTGAGTRKDANWDTAYTHSQSAHFSGSYTDLTNVPSTFAPSSHNHAASEITSGTLATARLPEFIEEKYIFTSNDSNAVYMPMVKGGMYATTSSSVTGQILIKMPSYKTNMMMQFYVDIYDYETGESLTFKISGYNNNDSNATWYNCSVVNLSDDTDRDYAVRFGADTSNSFQYVTIGETNSVWSYPQINVRDFYGGYSTAESDAQGSFNVSFVTSTPGSVSRTHAGNLVATRWNSIANKPSTFTPSAHNQAWSTITSTPTTISGYGITDAFSGNYNDLSNRPTIPTDFVSKANGGTFSGNITVDDGTSSTLWVKCDDGGNAIIRASGEGQGTGVLEVGQSTSYGGGMSYNGDGSPAWASGETADNITFYRMSSGTRTEVFSYPYSGNTVTFNGDINVNGGDIVLGGTGRIQGIDTVSATTDAANKAYVDAHTYSHNHAASNITSGTFSTARIPNLAASKITSGTFAAARIAHNSFDLGDTTAETGRSVHETGIYTFNRNNGTLGTGTDSSYYSVLAYGQGSGGSVQIAGQWTSGGNKLYWRSLRDTTDNWWSWKEIYHTGHKPTASEIGAASSSHNHDSTYVNITGDTMTGTLGSSKNGAAIQMDGGGSAEGIRMQPDSSTTYPVFLRSLNPGSGEASPWIYKEQATQWGIYHNNPLNSLDFTRSPSTGIANDVGGGDNTVMMRLDMAAGMGQFMKVRTHHNSSQAAPRYDTSFYVAQSQHYYGQNGSQTMYLGESGNDVLIRGQVAIGGTAIQSGYNLTMTGSIDMNNSSIDYVNQLHFNDNVRFYDDGNDNYLNFKWGDHGAGGIKMIDGQGHLNGYFYCDGTDQIGILDADGQWAVRVDKDVAVDLRVNNSSRIICDTGGTEFRNGGTTVGEVTTSGVARFANDVVAYYSFSDQRLKTNIKHTTNNLDKILKLEPVEYTWKDGGREGKKEIGLIAQDVEKVVPEVVRENERLNDDALYKQVDYEHLVSTLIGAIQEQQDQIAELKSEVTNLKSTMCKCKN